MLQTRAERDIILAVEWECNRTGLGPRRGVERTLGSSIGFTNNQSQWKYILTANIVTSPAHLTPLRNRFAHEAGAFPTDVELADFVTDTLAEIREIIAWR